MPYRLECGLMKVGNSTVLVLPKSLLENYGIKAAEKNEKPVKLSVLATDNGIFVPLKQKKALKEELRNLIKETR